MIPTLANINTVSIEQRRILIDTFDAELAKQPGALTAEAFEVRHYFTNTGLYARELTVPKGIIFTGRIKKDEHISVISCGYVTSVTEAGLASFGAPTTMVSLPGTKRIVLTHELTVWTTIHRTDKTNLADVEADIIAEDYIALPGQLNLDLGGLQ